MHIQKLILITLFVGMPVAASASLPSCFETLWLGNARVGGIKRISSTDGGNPENSVVEAIQIACEQIDNGTQATSAKLILELLSERGSIEASYAVGVLYLFGHLGTQNIQKAREYFRTASESNNPRAIAALNASNYGSRLTSEKWIENQWIANNAQKGIAEAQFNIGTWANQYEGYRVNQIGREWLLKAANQGHPGALFAAFRIFENSDPIKSVDYLISAAYGGSVDAQIVLANKYRFGDPSFRDYNKAYHWLLAAASNGDRASLHNLGELYQKGFGVSVNLSIAYALYFLGYQHLTDIWEALESYHPLIEEEMARDELVKARQLVREIITTHRLREILERESGTRVAN